MKAQDARLIAKAYAAVEKLDDFRAGELAGYRRERLAKYADYPALARAALGRKPLRLLDVGSGSSALAYALDDAGAVSHADCLEPSPSRHAFAEKWKADEGRSRVANHRRAALDFAYGEKTHDALFCVDHTFAYLAAAYGPKELSRLLRLWRRALRPGGLAFVQVTLFSKVRAAMEKAGFDRVQSFDEARGGRFRFSLAEFRLKGKDRMGVRSVYVAADGRVLEKEEVSRLFTKPELVKLFRRHGFKPVAAWRDPARRPFRKGDDAVFLVFRA